MMILIVEDHEDTAHAMAKLLSFAGYETYTASSCAQARQLCKILQPRVMLCDLDLPDGSGLELCREFKMEFPQIRAIAATGFDGHEDIAKMEEAGFMAHMVKPIDSIALQKVIVQVCLATPEVGSHRPVPDELNIFHHAHS